jgi:anti-anti-sigma factor
MVGLAATDLTMTTAELGGSAYVLAVTGELDPASSRRLAGGLDSVLARGASHVAVDLSGVRLVDSSALKVLVERTRSLGERGGELVLVVDLPTLRLLEITQLARLFRIERSLAEAIDRFLVTRLANAS